MNRIIFFVATVVAIFCFYKCSNIAPENTKYYAPLVAEIDRISEDDNFLCVRTYPVDAYPYSADSSYIRDSYSKASEYSRAEPVSSGDVRFRDLVAAGLLRENERRNLDLNLVGYDYELTSKGRELYSQSTSSLGKKQAQFCFGKPALKQVSAIKTQGYSIQGLNVMVKYTLKVEQGGPYLYDGTAQALGIKVPARATSGEIILPEMNAEVVLERDTNKVLSFEPMRAGESGFR